jgi:hypothetical protein
MAHQLIDDAGRDAGVPPARWRRCAAGHGDHAGLGGPGRLRLPPRRPCRPAAGWWSTVALERPAGCRCYPRARGGPDPQVGHRRPAGGRWPGGPGRTSPPPARWPGSGFGLEAAAEPASLIAHLDDLDAAHLGEDPTAAQAQQLLGIANYPAHRAGRQPGEAAWRNGRRRAPLRSRIAGAGPGAVRRGVGPLHQCRPGRGRAASKRVRPASWAGHRRQRRPGRRPAFARPPARVMRSGCAVSGGRRPSRCCAGRRAGRAGRLQAPARGPTCRRCGGGRNRPPGR